MRLYHYTNIETLALILRNKTIRFNRLDNVDDLEEGRAESLGVKFCRYVFVSCWTKVEEENIPLWKMYGGDKGGIRISLEHDMFQEYPIENQDYHGGKNFGYTYPYSKIPTKDMFQQEFSFIPIHEYDNDFFFRDVRYVDEVFQYTKDKIRISKLHDNNRGDVNMDMKPFGYYKHKRWSFQRESRFVLYALPCNPWLESDNPNLTTIITNTLLQNKPLPFTYYDLYLRKEVFDGMIITLSPSITEAQKIIVTTLRDQYAPMAKIEESSLGELVRLK